MEPVVRITVERRLALTVEQAAVRYGLTRKAMEVQLSRFGEIIEPVTYLDGRKPLYLAKKLDALMKERPGKGSPGRKRASRKQD